jgi:signal transduction histidine kinase
MRQKKIIKFFVWISVCNSICYSLIAQPAISAIEVSTIPLADSIINQCQLYVDSSNSLKFDSLPTVLYFSAINATNKKITSYKLAHPLYLRFCLKNSADTAITVFFFPGLYYKKIDLFLQTTNSGKLEPIASNHSVESATPNAYRAITLLPTSKQIYIARLELVPTSVNYLLPHIIRDYYLPQFTQSLQTPAQYAHIASYIIVGILLMMAIYSLAVYCLNGGIAFLYYLLFCSLMAVLFFIKSFLFHSATTFNYFFESYLDLMVLCAATYCYLLFIQQFIEAKKSWPFLSKLFEVSKVITIIGATLFTFCFFGINNYNYLNTTETNLKYGWSSITIVFIVYAFTQKNKLLHYLAIGHLLYLLAIVYALVLMALPNIFEKKNVSLWYNSLFFTELGLTLELIFFLLALAFKNRDNLIERTRERERLTMDNERKELEKKLAVVHAKQEERNRISTDMHDELGSGVTAIRLMSEIMRSKMKDAVLPEVDKISHSANELHNKMNTIIWTMNSSHDTLDNLIAYVRAEAVELLETASIRCHFNAPEQVEHIIMSGEKRRNIFLCIKETLNNTLKYAAATEVAIYIDVAFNELKITIQDNGVGIDIKNVLICTNGLGNLKKRMESMGGSFNIEKHQGTISTFILPL